MRRVLALLVVAAFALPLASCRDARSPVAPDGTPPSAVPDIVDGTSGVEGANPFFFWLPPMVGQPDAALLGTFDPAQRPALRLVCWETNDPAVTVCDPTVPIAEFTVGAGMVVETDHYKVELDTKAFDLATSDAEASTTYRLLALTPPLDEAIFPGLDVNRGPGLGSYVYGLADVQLGANGGAARSLSTDETIGLVDGRTLPVRFRLDEGALAEEIRVNTAEAAADPGQALCQINCSVTVIDPDEPTEASLENADGEELTAMLIPAGAVWTDETAVLVIDQRATEGEADNCAPGASLRDSDCFRYELSPDNPEGDDFTEVVRFGICPTGEVLQNGTIDPRWRLFKFDAGGDPELTRPVETDVSDFLACEVTTTSTVSLWDGPGGELAGAALTWLVRPLRASDFFGGQLRDLSDLFWGLDASFPEEDFDAGTLEAGLQVGVSVTILATHPEPDVPAEGVSVTFSLVEGSGELAVPDGVTPVATERDMDDRLVGITLLTDESGQAFVNYTVGEGSNLVEATSDEAVGGPWSFTVTGTVAEGAAFTDVAAAEEHSCGLTADGRVFCWGDNQSGQLGDGTTASSSIPVQVASSETFVSLDAAGHSTCALASNGELHCWGDNQFGQLGDGSTTSTSTPVPVSGGSILFESFDAGWGHVCGIGQDGVTYCWGDDRFAEVGDGPGSQSTCQLDASSVACSPTPQAISSSFVAVSAGIIHTCALDASGAASCWGTDVGAFGNGDETGGEIASPVPAFGGFPLTGITAGAGFTCAVEGDGDVSCSGGFNQAGQLGNGTTDGTRTPLAVSGGLSFDRVLGKDGNSSLTHTCGVTTDGVGYCWGANFNGELGDPSSETCSFDSQEGTITFGCSTVPVAVSGGLSFREIDPGGPTLTPAGNHTCGLTTDGRIFCWGSNDDGQLGDGTTSSRSSPVEVVLP